MRKVKGRPEGQLDLSATSASSAMGETRTKTVAIWTYPIVVVADAPKAAASSRSLDTLAIPQQRNSISAVESPR